jgi:hypothetical protein
MHIVETVLSSTATRLEVGTFMLFSSSKSSLAFFALALVAAGCSQQPSRVSAPNIDPDDTAAAALELYDSNHDGSLDKEELVKSPAVLQSLTVYDQNGDGKVGADEFAARLAELFGKRIGLTEVSSKVTYQGRPLKDAVVVFEPEPYLGEEVPEARGTTDANGIASMAIAAENLPENLRQRNRSLTKVGIYKVRITHPSMTLPDKYNTQTTLGYETQIGSPFAKFSLTAK